ncbi:isoleucine--tRNA ligase [Treponema primitia ZAS-2]|uniref:Isoleucine--tRNA ligase n=1 Tax=Treponema primitia (strain ATCC BAA-887 / DSM 12427 / ZAS-2) TaxID=545694 RepID=F5YGP8_TREPZ|nr:isoleucine--tRNA ligase [Treponema primitia]AEF84375.1 isoleucine--tRNA ligase [Treponema primitia ZAS-2]
MYQAVDPKVSFPKLEEEILSFWEKNDIFKKSVSQRDGATEYVFYDGPPFATGMPHFGHFVPSTIKDIIPRYQAMKGKKVERRFGWDCHGLPVENLIEKELGLNSKTDIEKFGVAEFNEACRASVLRYVDEWRNVITRLGRWVDFDHDYKTMDADYMETIWWVMKSLWEKGLLYEGHYILPYCPRCSTVLSNHELNLGGYKDVHDPAITVRFKVTGITPASPASAQTGLNGLADGATYLLAWTTTPWTLPSNLALTLGPDIDYVLVQDAGDVLPAHPQRYILAEARLSAYYKSPDEYTIIWKQKGADLIGIKYEPLFPYFKEAAEQNAFRTYPGDFVSTSDGTGIVHTAPGFGEDDARVLKGTGVPVICPIDAECRFTAEVSDYQGIFVKDADKPIMDRLKAEGKLVKREQILHAYPHCWRCGHPLIYRAVGSWFVNVEKIKQDMLDANNQIYWVPEHIKAGRFGKWLEGARDWAISRNRYWGNPLPIWKCPDCGKTICVGSRAELKELSGVEATDLHKHFVDKISIPCKAAPGGSKDCGGTMTRIPEVLDCWFESGAMPYGQNHYPFENKEFFDSHFPADFINEGLDQTRGWFYTLTILAAALFKKPAFNNCIVSGLVLASDGKKMSKSLKNYTDPMEVVNSFGADALRLFLIHSAVVKADDLRYSDEGVRDVMKSILIPLWNAYSFYVTYANIDKADPAGAPENPSNPLDKWILSAAESLTEKVGAALDAYDLSRAVDPILEFIDLLNNWYIRRSRRRFWRSENDSDKAEAYSALYDVLKTLITVAAPFMPFTTDAIWQNLRREGESESVHLADYPLARESRRDRDLEFRMAAVQHAVSMGRSLRSQYNIKVRQPLRTVELVTRNPDEKKVLLEMEEIIREELNVKSVIFRNNEEDLVEYQAKANFRVLGKELGKDMKAAASRIEALSQAEIQGLLEGATLSIDVAVSSGTSLTVEITAEKLDIRRIEKANLRVLNEGTLTVGLDTVVSEELSREGDVRDLVRGVQNLRKDTGLEVTDRIGITLFGSDRLKAAWESFAGYVAAETLAKSVDWGQAEGQTPVDAGDEQWLVSLRKV